MADVVQQHNNDHQQQQQANELCKINDDNTSSLIEQIYEQLVCIRSLNILGTGMRQDDLELTEKLTSIYHGLCGLRQSLTNPQMNSTTDITTIPIQIDSPTSSSYHTKQRSDSEPNILSDRQRIITIIEDLN